MIGVIGGNGVAATNRLCYLIEDKVTKKGAFRDAHHPEMIVWQATQVPSRSMYLEGRGESFIPGYVEIGRKLKACGCTSLCMCCNTAHYAINELQEQIGLPFINLLEEVAKEANRNGVKRIGMMCSDGLRRIKLYDKWFEKVNTEMHLVYPNEEMQKLVTKGICNAKNTTRFDSTNVEYPGKLFSKVCEHLISQGVDCIVGGCTDISAVFCPSVVSNGCHDVIYFDSLTVLASTIVNTENQL
jgi:aspartate racemase